ncbi:hypothetical protein [Helicobacter typhlonius]|uniref:hypothetical protein n=1 Tax=Helicobacter typhlonius TaxID=76936 RepID=UPI002FE1F9E4
MSTVKASIFDVRTNQNMSLFARQFDEIIKELASKLDDINGRNIRVLYKDTKGKETSIWFDSFDYQKDFDNDETLKNSICFLLAKDIDFSMVENKECNQLDAVVADKKICPKIPSHCIYIPNEKILIIEESSNSAGIKTMEKGIFKKIPECKDFLHFQAKNRENIIERLKFFSDKIQSIELIDLNLTNYVKEDHSGKILDIITHNRVKLKATLAIEDDKGLKNKIVDLFANIFESQYTRELRNIKVKIKDENEHKEIIDLYSNLVYLKIEKEHYYTDIAVLQNNENERIEYSKSVYRSLIEAYNVQKQ